MFASPVGPVGLAWTRRGACCLELGHPDSEEATALRLGSADQRGLEDGIQVRRFNELDRGGFGHVK